MTYRTITEMSELTALPDGTLLRWLAVPNDPTSVAVAFLRRTDREQYSGIREDEAAGIRDNVTITNYWISPGNGWEPESISLVVFPVDVLTLSNTVSGSAENAGRLEWPEMPIPPELQHLTPLPSIESFSGGTYPRDVALQAAATIFQGSPPSNDDQTVTVLSVAELFAQWLTADDVPDEDDNTEDADQPGYFVGGPWTRPAAES